MTPEADVEETRHVDERERVREALEKSTRLLRKLLTALENDSAVTSEEGLRRDLRRSRRQIRANRQILGAGRPVVEEPQGLDHDPAPTAAVSLAEAGFDDLRGLGMTVSQAKRVLRYRDERQAVSTVDDLENVPGFPRRFLDEVKRRLEP